MSEVSREKVFDRVIDLYIHADTVTADWTTRLVTVQTSLVIAEGVLLGWKGDHPNLLLYSLAMLIAIVGLYSLILLTNIIVREHEYGHRYEAMLKRAEGSNPILFSDADSAIPGLKFKIAVPLLGGILALSWVIFLVVLLLWFVRLS